MHPNKVLLLEDDPDLSAVLARLIELHSKCLQCKSVDELVESGAAALESTIAFLDIELGRDRPNGLDAFRWLHGEGYKGRVYFLTAHGSNHPIVRRALAESDSEVLAKPVSPRTLLNLIEECGA